MPKRPQSGDIDIDFVRRKCRQERGGAVSREERVLKELEKLAFGDGPVAGKLKAMELLGKHLGINQKIIDAEPTDGLWNDGRNDTDQLGMSYAELEKAMTNKNDPNYQKYLEIRKKNLHKMEPIPVCKFND